MNGDQMIELTAHVQPELVRVTIADRGKGFHPSAQDAGDRMGLALAGALADSLRLDGERGVVAFEARA